MARAQASAFLRVVDTSEVCLYVFLQHASRDSVYISLCFKVILSVLPVQEPSCFLAEKLAKEESELSEYRTVASTMSMPLEINVYGFPLKKEILYSEFPAVFSRSTTTQQLEVWFCKLPYQYSQRCL